MMADKKTSIGDVLRTFNKIRKQRGGDQSVLSHLTQGENCGWLDGLKLAAKKLMDEAEKSK